MLRAFLLLVAALPGLALAQSSPDTLRRGLLVGYADDFSFRAFNGGLVSLTFERSPTRAFRVGVDVEITGTAQRDKLSAEDDSEQTPPGFETTFTSTEQSTLDNTLARFDLVVEAVRYPASGGRMRPYVLAGVFGGPRLTRLDTERRTVNRNEQRPTNQPPFAETQTVVLDNANRATAWGAGLSGGLGVEWQVADDLSLLAEYRGALFFERSVNRTESVRRTTFTNSVNTNTATIVSTDVSRFTQRTYGFRSLGLRAGAVLYF